MTEYTAYYVRGVNIWRLLAVHPSPGQVRMGDTLNTNTIEQLKAEGVGDVMVLKRSEVSFPDIAVYGGSTEKLGEVFNLREGGL